MVCFVLPERETQVLGGRKCRQVFVLQAFGSRFSRGSKMNADGSCLCCALGEKVCHKLRLNNLVVGNVLIQLCHELNDCEVTGSTTAEEQQE